MTRELSLLVCLALPLTLGAGDAKQEQDKLQGTWQATACVADGKAAPKEQLSNVKVVFVVDRMSFFPPDGDGKQALELTFKLDTSKKPRHLDATPSEGASKGKPAEGIYELDGDTLKLCLQIRPGKGRPTEFKVPEGSGLLLLELKRAKP